MPNPQLSRSNRTTGGSGGNGGGKKPPASAKKKSSPKKKRITGKRVFWTLFFTAAFAVLCALGGYLFITVNGEKILAANKDKIEIKAPTVIYDRTGVQIGEIKIQRGEEVEAQEIPELLKNAFIATEDKRFFEHSGVDLRSIGRAAVRDIVARSAVEGGSTITQQLAKNIFLSADKTFFRKATEVSIALALERNYQKDEILAMYLNRISFGGQYYGIKAASERYFGKSDLNDLELWEMATLAAMPKAPTRYNPIANPDKSKERRAVVLQLMYEQGYITEAEKDKAAAVDYNYTPPETKETHYQAFIDYVLQEAEDTTALTEDDLNRGGYKIYTTMDAKAQQSLEDAFKDDSLFEQSPDDQPVQASMTITNNQNGSIVAILGARNYHKGDFNRAVNSRRQPGSAFKPIASYAPALESGQFTVDSRLSNEEQSFGNYSPKNLHGYSETVSMKEALSESINIPAVWLLNQIGVETGYRFAQALGIPLTENDRNLSIALGGLSKGTNTLEMAQAYNAFANGGNFVEAYSIKSIRDSNEVEIYSRLDESKPVMSAQTAYEMTDMMKSVVTDGTGQKADIGRPLAGKTGTTQSGIEGNSANRDVWFVGYTPEWTGAVWMGYDKPDSAHMLNNSSGLAASMFARVMSEALEGTPVTDFKAPDAPVQEEPVETQEPEEQPEQTEPVGAPSGLVASYDVAGEKVALSWQPVAGDNVRYRLYRQESSEAQPSLLTDGLTAASAEDPSALPGLTYSYAVTAYRAGEDPIVESAASNTVSLTVPAEDNSQEELPEVTTPTEEEEEVPEPDESEEPAVPPASENGQNGAENGNGNQGNNGNGNGNGNGNENGNGNGNGNSGNNENGQNGSETTDPETVTPPAEEDSTGGEITDPDTAAPEAPADQTTPDPAEDSSTDPNAQSDPAAVDPNAAAQEETTTQP